jgi:hypothetical protein
LFLYEIVSGSLYDPQSNFLTRGYAGGNCGRNPEGVNNPDLCNVRDVGPLPPGDYTIGAPVEHPKLGPFALPLTPAATNEMFGRSDFFMHGDNPAENESASEGCPVVRRPTRETVNESSDKLLRVVGVISGN